MVGSVVVVFVAGAGVGSVAGAGVGSVAGADTGVGVGGTGGTADCVGAFFNGLPQEAQKAAESAFWLPQNGQNMMKNPFRNNI